MNRSTGCAARSSIAALLVAACVFGACSSREERAERSHADALAAIQAGDRPRALGAIRVYRRDSGDTADEALEVARLLIAAGAAGKARWHLEDALARHPDRNDLRLGLAQVCVGLRDPHAAANLVRAIPITSEHGADALLVRAEAELALGELDDSLATLRELVSLHPDDSRAPLALVGQLVERERYDEARSAIASARDVVDTPELARHLDLVLVRIALAEEHPEAALEILDRLVLEQPEDVAAWSELDRALLDLGRGEETATRLEEALAATGPTGPLIEFAVTLYRRVGRHDAVASLLRGEVERTASVASFLRLAGFEASRGDVDAARSTLEYAVSTLPDEEMVHVALAELQIETGDLDDAQDSARTAQALFADASPHAAYLAARLALARGDATGAAEQLRVLAPHLDRPTLQYWLGRALEASGDFDGAWRRYALAEQRAVGWEAPTVALLALAKERGEWMNVIEHAAQLVALDPECFEGWEALLEGTLRRGDATGSLAIARHLVEAFPDRPEAAGRLAATLFETGEEEEAFAVLDASDARFGPQPTTTAARARWLARSGRLAEAKATVAAAMASHPDDASLHHTLAIVHFASGDAAAGAAAVDRALALDPDDLSPLRERCRFHAAAGMSRAAVRDCDRYVATHPLDAEAHLYLAFAHQGVRDDDAAIDAYREAARLAPGDHRSRNNLAELLAVRGDLDEALELAQEARRLAPDVPEVSDTLGWLYLEKGLVARAISFLEEAHAGLPDRPGPALHLAAAYDQAGREAEAETLRRSVEPERRNDALPRR